MSNLKFKPVQDEVFAGSESLAMPVLATGATNDSDFPEEIATQPRHERQPLPQLHFEESEFQLFRVR